MSSDDDTSTPTQGWCIIGNRAYFVAEASSILRPIPRAAHQREMPPWIKPRIIEIMRPMSQADKEWEEKRTAYYARKAKAKWARSRIIKPTRMQRWREAKRRQWAALVPSDVAASQVKREMWLAISRAHKAGASQKDLAAWLGVSRGRISQGILGIEWRVTCYETINPVERYTAFTRGEMRELARALKVKPQQKRRRGSRTVDAA